MKIRNIITLLCITGIIMSCGGKKKAISQAKKEQPKVQVAPKREIKKEITIIPKEKEVKKPSAPVSYTNKVQDYITTYQQIAQKEMKAYGIPASITLAQGILESGAGHGTLAKRANNHFGIKCHGWEGEKVYHDDDKAQECFRKYEDASTSFKDHSVFLAHRKRYSKLFTYKKDDYKSWARGLKAAGYATDKKYPAKLISIIERYQLYTYDHEVLGTSRTPSTPKPVVHRTEKHTTPSQTKHQRPSSTTSTPVVNREVKSYSRTSTTHHTVQKGETLYAISKQYQLTVATLQSYNALTDNTIAVGQVLRVQPREAVPSAEEHIVQQGETLYSISQQYNSTVAVLKSDNNLLNHTISVGQVLKIRKEQQETEEQDQELEEAF